MTDGDRERVVAEARRWIGTPYHSGAKVLGVGVDCVQLLIAAYEGAGVLFPGEVETGYYSPQWHLHRSEELYLRGVMRFCDKVAEGDELPGDVALFRYGRTVSHGGLVSKWPYVIHSYVGLGVVESAVTDALFLMRDGASRLRGVYRPRR